MTGAGYQVPTNRLGIAPGDDCISIVVPTLNEVDNIDIIVAAIFEEVRPGLTFEVLVADGRSRDGTVERVQAWEKKAPVRLVTGDGTSGLAGDVLNAARQAKGSIIVVMDADLSHPTTRIPDLVAPIRAGTSDMVVGSRYVPGGDVPDWPFVRRALSRLGCMAAWPFTDVKDSMSGFFAVRRELLVAVDPKAAGFKIGLEIMAAEGDDIRVSEVPIVFRDREHGTSKIGSKQLFQYGGRLMVLAGGAISASTIGKFATVGALGIAVDYTIFKVLSALGLSLLTAHVASFLCAAAFNYALNSRWSFASTRALLAEPEWATFGRFFGVSLMALFLRGGVIALAMSTWHWSKEWALLLGIGAGTIVNYLGSAFFVFPPAGSRISPSVRWRVASVAVVLYAVLLRLVYMRTLNLIPEEAYYWNYAQHLDYGYLDHPPMTAWLIALTEWIFGKSEFAVRSGALALWAVTAAFMFNYARNLFSQTAAFVTLMLVAGLPFLFAIGFLMMPDAPLTAAWAGSLFFAERALLAERKTAWIGLGAALGLGMLSKYSIALLGLPILLFMALDPRSRAWFLKPWPYLAVILALILFSPVIAWNAAHEWASFAFQSTRRVEGAFRFSLPMLIASILALITPIGMISAHRILKPKALAREHLAALLQDRRWLFISLFTLAPLSVFATFSIFHAVKLNWTGPLWLAVLPAIAKLIATKSVAPVFGKLSFHGGWRQTLATVLVIFGGGLHYMAIGLPGVSYRGGAHMRDFPVAWRELGQQVERIRQDARGPGDQSPLLAGLDKYFIASELAFYIPGNAGAEHSAGRGLFQIDAADGGSEKSGSLMYDYWFPAEKQTGRTIVMVSFNAAQLETPAVISRFKEVGQVKSESVVRDGDVLGQFFYRTGYDYRSGPVLPPAAR
jgi:dolichol-phosphate mannosyltransferase